MDKYLISCPAAAMVVPDRELAAVGRDAHAVIEEAKAAGVYVFAGGIEGSVAKTDPFPRFPKPPRLFCAQPPTPVAG